MASESDAWPGAVWKTPNSTGKMGSGEIMGGGRGHDKQNKSNPYGCDPEQGPATHGGRPAKSEENY